MTVARDIVVIGGSAGAIAALRMILPALPPELPAAVFIVVHTASDNPGVLPQLLSGSTWLPVEHASDGASIRHGRVYVAPPDHHLLLDVTGMKLTRGPRENRFRPAIDPLFRTAANAFGPRVVGIILSGALDDGVLGLAYISRRGGITIAQHPESADVPSMPQTAIRDVGVDHVLPVERIAETLIQLAAVPVEGRQDVAETHDRPDVTEAGTSALRHADSLGPPSPFTCPECGGALWELRDGEIVRFQCHVGHAYSGESLVDSQSEALEAALWSALRALEESAALRHRMADNARSRGMEEIANGYEAHAQDRWARADLIRTVLLSDSPPDITTGELEAEPERRDRDR